MQDDLMEYLGTLEHGECYRIDAVLKESAQEVTQRVFLIGADGSERGPFIRKQIVLESGLGEAYERIWEAQLAGKRFLHLPRIIEYVDDGMYRNVVMEYVTGDTLDSVIRSAEHSDELAFTISILLCDAVMELHECFTPPLIHRDLKPSNVILSPANLTLIDFGISRTFDEGAVHDTRSFGTRGYAPPEQFGYGQTDERSDVYALGMLIAYCFLREEPDRTLVDGGFDDPRIPETLRPVLAKATAFDPQQRYGSVRELKDDPRMLQVVEGVCKGEASAPFPAPTVPDAHVLEKAPKRVADKRLPKLHLPIWAGRVWNVLILLTWLLFAIAALVLTFAPDANSVAMAFPARLVCYPGIFVFGFGVLAYAVLDKRELRKHIPFLTRFTWRQELPFCLAVGLVVIFGSAILSSVINSMSGL